MIRYRVVVPAELRIFLVHLSPVVKSKIHASLRLLEQDPLVGKPLERELSGFCSFPIPPYRIVYRADPSRRMVNVVRVGHRKDICEILVEKLDSDEIRERRAIYVRR